MVIKFKKILKGAHVIFKIAIKNSHDNGRLKNGMIIAVPVQIKEHISDIIGYIGYFAEAFRR